MSSATHSDPFPPTRSSLLSRVKHPSDAEGWRQFHQQYARLVFQVCLKAGLKKEDADDVAQDTLAAVAKQMPEFQLDRSRGSFRGWLHRITSNKVADFLRRHYREAAVRGEPPEGGVDETAGHVASAIDEAWDGEWRDYLLQRALEKVQGQVSARSMQIFHLSAVNGWSVEKIRSTLGLARTPVYLARYRVGSLVKKEIARLRRELE